MPEPVPGIPIVPSLVALGKSAPKDVAPGDKAPIALNPQLSCAGTFQLDGKYIRSRPAAAYDEHGAVSFRRDRLSSRAQLVDQRCGIASVANGVEVPRLDEIDNVVVFVAEADV